MTLTYTFGAFKDAKGQKYFQLGNMYSDNILLYFNCYSSTLLYSTLHIINGNGSE